MYFETFNRHIKKMCFNKYVLRVEVGRVDSVITRPLNPARAYAHAQTTGIDRWRPWPILTLNPKP